MSEKLWGGRFAADITDSVLQYTETVSVDGRLLKYDMWQNLAHVLMLGHVGINDARTTAQLAHGLLELEEQRAVGQLSLNIEYEDVHLNTERMLIDKVGPDLGGRMHTARSRNDQVQTDARMVTREWILEAVSSILDFARDLLTAPEAERSQVIPGYTHSQAAQPISVAFGKAAHAQALLRDAERLVDAWQRVDKSPLGSCALAGTSFALDRTMTAELLGFASAMPNALDATSTRDWTVETASAVAIAATNLSRMQEEIVVWSSNEYSLVEVDDSFATGSSIMPQKKNPVVAELARAKCGRAVGALVQLLVMEKSVGLGYSCDLQDDKPVYWDALDTYLDTVRICREQMATMTFHADRGLELCWSNFSTATELANYLVTDHNIPFRSAHKITGELVSHLIAERATLQDCARAARFLSEQHHISVSADTLRTLFDPVNTLNGYTSSGGTSPTSVLQQQELGQSRTQELSDWVTRKRTDLEDARRDTFARARQAARGAATTSTASETKGAA